MATTKKTQYVAEEPLPEFTLTDDAPQEEDRHPEYEDFFSQEEETAPVIQVAPASTFAYEVGHQVLPAPEAPARQVIWRGHLKVRRPDTGLVHRVNVYRLNDGFWDCYQEDELHAA